MGDPEIKITNVLGAETLAGPTGRPLQLRISVADREGPFHLVFAEEGARQLAHVLQAHLERWRLSGIVGPMA
jgi:hypothetical protein